MEGPSTSALHRILLHEKAQHDDLVKEHKQNRLLCSRLQEDCERCKQEKEELLESLKSFQDGFAENSKMLCTLDQAVQDLAIARQELAVSSQTAAENRTKAERLEKVKASLITEMNAKAEQAAQELAALRKASDEEISRLQQSLDIEKTKNKATIQQLHAQHDNQVAKLQRELEVAVRARDETERKLETERKSFQVSLGSLGTGQSDAVASLKQRIWALRNELESTKKERDDFKRQCTRS